MAIPPSDASFYDLQKAQVDFRNYCTQKTYEFIIRYEETYYISVGNREERKEMEDFIFMKEKEMEGSKFMEKEMMKRTMEAIQRIEANIPKRNKVAGYIYEEARSAAKRQILEEINKPEVQACLREYNAEEFEKPKLQYESDESDDDDYAEDM